MSYEVISFVVTIVIFLIVLVASVAFFVGFWEGLDVGSPLEFLADLGERAGRLVRGKRKNRS